MIERMRTENVFGEISEGLADEAPLATDMVAINQVKRDRLVNLLAHLFWNIEKTGSYVFRMVISPRVQLLIRQLYKHDNFPFCEGTRREFVDTGMVANLWTADVFLDKDCIGIVLYSAEDADQITEEHPQIRQKWYSVRDQTDPGRK